MTGPRASIVLPAYNEHESIVSALLAIRDAVMMPHEILVVVDTETDTTVAAAQATIEGMPNARILVQDYGRGPANAIRYGIDHALAPCVVVTMADGSDDVRVIDELVRLVESGFVVASASRYMRGGAQHGGPMLKRVMSEAAGRSLYLLARVGTRDVTNAFKAYDTAFVREVGIHSRSGFEVALELVSKARRTRRPVAEVPTVWLARKVGTSNFKVVAWIPNYLYWYRFAFGPRLDPRTVQACMQPELEGAR
ncbi:glycosyltransferase family 2 protein [Terrabacter sp. NPDC080008]|uniref:glycosyltransferase family 2 protein n=1 Tax=Terrabacter sp. NPDC080008 TaxID=3155176 RepID=UPI00345084BA